MWRNFLLRAVNPLILKAGPKCSRLALPHINAYQFRLSSQDRKPKRRVNSEDSFLPEPPTLSPDDESFLSDLEIMDYEVNDAASGLGKGAQDLPEVPPSMSSDVDFDVDLEADDDDVEEDIEPVPYVPPVRKMVGNLEEKQHFLTASGQADMGVGDGSEREGSSEIEQAIGFKIDPSLEPVLAAWVRAVAPTPAAGPMPLHELANRSTKIKELVKLGVDFSRIAGRHGDLERLLHLNWEEQIKPKIRFFVDCGIEPDRLGSIITRNTALLWTDNDDVEVRLNYLEAKNFTKEQIKNIINRAPFWLTLSTKELDGRLGFLQRTFTLPGSEVRFIASTYPSVVSNRRWGTLVDTNKLMDRELGLTAWERKKLLFSNPQCFLRPSTLRKAFDFCHNEIGLSHNQLVMHAFLLTNRVSTMRPRYNFLKFLKRNIFDTQDPLYLSPDWLWKGTTEEFCTQAAKSTVEDYENFLKHSML